MHKTTIAFEGRPYDAGETEAAYKADAFLLPDGRVLVAQWAESMPPQVKSVGAVDIARFGDKPITMIRLVPVRTTYAGVASMTGALMPGEAIGDKN